MSIVRHDRPASHSVERCIGDREFAGRVRTVGSSGGRFTLGTGLATWVGCVSLLLISVGCDSDGDDVRSIRAERQLRQSRTDDVDHLGEAFELFDTLTTLNREQAERRILFHLNRWIDDQNVSGEPSELSPLFKPIINLVGADDVRREYASDNFDGDDVTYLRDAHLMERIVRWVDAADSGFDDPLLAEWIASQDDRRAEALRTASRLFDFIVRHVADEPPQITLPSSVEWPEEAARLGLVLGGAGYRQSNYQTLFRGSGDWLASSALWIELCRSAGVDATMIAVPNNAAASNDTDSDNTATSEMMPWVCAAIIDGDAYLFDIRLRVHIPGKDGIGIATLAEAKRDDTILRRMKVPGFFDYALSRRDIQSCIALIPLRAVATSPRMATLQSRLTGDRRMRLYVDIKRLTKTIDDAAGISDVKLWSLPYLRDRYDEAIAKVESRDARLAAINQARWMMVESELPKARELATGRLRQLKGQFVDDENDGIDGARTIYLSQRSPEFEIADLQTDLQLQMRYGIRRQKGEREEDYRRSVAMVQEMIREAKRTATYWLSLLQYDDGSFDNARNWLEKRVLIGDNSRWELQARYNLARTLERTGDFDKAVEIYKTRGLPGEHGHRLRARLVAKQADANEPSDDDGGGDD